MRDADDVFVWSVYKQSVKIRVSIEFLCPFLGSRSDCWIEAGEELSVSECGGIVEYRVLVQWRYFREFCEELMVREAFG